MDRLIGQGRVWQLLALNDEMRKNGYISREEHQFIRENQVKKLTNLRSQGIIETEDHPVA